MNKRGGARVGAGRPIGSKAPKKSKPEEERRSVLFFGVRYTQDEAKKLYEAIRKSKKSSSVWIRESLLKAI